VSQFRDAYDEFRRAGFEVAAISVDSPYSHRAWAKELGVDYPLISDFARELATSYRIPLRIDGALPGTTKRSAFVIDSDKIVRYAWYAPEGKGLPPVDEILTVVQDCSPVR
jgi:glutaredoxin-dependent peroxiredoxin